jgi:hypothetical protein
MRERPTSPGADHRGFTETVPNRNAVSTMRAGLESFYVRAELWAYAHPWVFSLPTGALVGSLPFIDPKPHRTFGSRAHTAIFIVVGVTLIMRLMFYVRAGARRSHSADG